MGATRWRVIYKVVIPSAKNGLMAAVLWVLVAALVRPAVAGKWLRVTRKGGAGAADETSRALYLGIFCFSSLSLSTLADMVVRHSKRGTRCLRHPTQRGKSKR